MYISALLDDVRLPLIFSGIALIKSLIRALGALSETTVFLLNVGLLVRDFSLIIAGFLGVRCFTECSL